MARDGALGALLPEQMAQLLEAFNAFDRDQDGLLDESEVGAVMQLCGFQVSHSEVVDMVTEVAPVSRKLLFEEFVFVLTRPLPGTSTLDETRKMFDTFAAVSGAITVDSLHAAFASLGHPVSVLLASDMVREADLDEDGVVNREDFIKAIP